MKPLPLPIRLAAGIAATAVERARELPTKLIGLPVTVTSQALQLSMRVQQQVTELAIKGDEALAALRPVEETPQWATFDEEIDQDRPDIVRPAPFDRVDLDADRRAPNRRANDETGLVDPDLDDPGLGGLDDPARADEGELDESELDDAAWDESEWDKSDPALTRNGHLSAVADALNSIEPHTESEIADLAADLEPDFPAGPPSAGPAGVDNYAELSLPQLRAKLRTFSVDQLEELLAFERATANRPSFVGMLTRRIAAVRDQR